LLALAVPPVHETLDPGSSDDERDSRGVPPDSWQPTGANAFLFYVHQLSDDVQSRLRELSSHFLLARGAATQSIYWANRCEHCGRLLSDHEVHCEPEGAFAPSSESAAANIELIHVNSSFLAAVSGYSLEPEFLRFMRKS
jgi:hypothetical protein